MPSWRLGRISLWLALAKSNLGWRRRSLRLLRPLLFTPRPKRARGNDKGKSKIDNVITPDELRILSVVPSHELVNRHVHKLVQILFYPNLLLLLSSLSLETILILFIFHYVLGEALPHLLVLSRALFYTGREAWICSARAADPSCAPNVNFAI